jgi:hypothetical protein
VRSSSARRVDANPKHGSGDSQRPILDLHELEDQSVQAAMGGSPSL